MKPAASRKTDSELRLLPAAAPCQRKSCHQWQSQTLDINTRFVL